MAEPAVEQRLAAILAADVAGYTRLMADDEPATIATITEYRTVFRTHIEANGGRVVDMAGDSILAVFTSAAGAVKAAVDAQCEVAGHNEELPEARCMRFRIGINLGDIREADDGTVYGDDVNVAARLEGLAEPGGVMISEFAYAQVRRNPHLGFADAGSHDVKNIAEPVRAWRVLTEPEEAGEAIVEPQATMWWKRPVAVIAASGIVLVIATVAIMVWQPWAPDMEPASVENMAFPLPDKPSIAVLPFTNMSGDPEQEYFVDGMTEAIITELARVPALFVIARNTTFTYKGKAVNVEQVGRELGVRYVIEGSVQKAGERVRITAQLIDASSGGHLWAERYDRALMDIFALQDDVTREIVAALEVKLAWPEDARRPVAHTENLDAYDLYLRAQEMSRQTTIESAREAQSLFEQAVSLDPDYAAAYAGLAWVHFRYWAMLWSNDPETLTRSRDAALRAVALDPSLSVAHQQLGRLELWRKEHDLAIATVERALALNPNDADSYAALAEMLNWSGEAERAIRMVKKAKRLDPRYPWYYDFTEGHSRYLAHQLDAAVAAFRAALDRNPDFMPAHGFLAATYAELGRTEEAEAAYAEVHRLSPRISLTLLAYRLPYRNKADLDRLLASAGDSGMPMNAP